MAGEGITHLIINSPYNEPMKFWQYDRQSRSFKLQEGKRRSAGYITATPDARGFDDPGIFVEIPLVNAIRPRVKAWREAGYAGITGTTQRLLQHWRANEERDESHRFFFCQLEAIETLIWLTEAPEAERIGIDIPSDGEAFRRVCSKMATRLGKADVAKWQMQRT